VFWITSATNVLLAMSLIIKMVLASIKAIMTPIALSVIKTIHAYNATLDIIGMTTPQPANQLKISLNSTANKNLGKIAVHATTTLVTTVQIVKWLILMVFAALRQN
jgi:hypothetical protein